MDMIEKVARAIFASKLINHDRGPWPDHSTVTKKFCLLAAVDVLRALREPTDDMVCGGDEKIIERLNDHTFALKEPTVAHLAFQAMIDVALSTNGQGGDGNG